LETEVTQEKIMQLRKTKGIIPDFNKALVGGYQCRDVDEYILNMKANTDQSQDLLKKKLEEYVSEFNLLSQEKEKLIRLKKEYETQLERLSAENAEKSRIEAQVRAEADRLKGSVEELQAQLENNDLKSSIEKTKLLEKENMQLRQQKSELAVEVEAVRKNEEDLRTNIEELKRQNAELAEHIDSIMISRRNREMATNLKLYQYRHKHETHIGSAVRSLQEMEKTLEAMKKELAEMYENTQIPADDDAHSR